jgi:uncharacterized protein YkwD
MHRFAATFSLEPPKWGKLDEVIAAILDAMFSRLQLLASAALVCAFLIAPAATAATKSESALLHEMNRVRAQQSLAPLSLNRNLERAAHDYSRTLLRTNVFTHGNFAARIRAYSLPGPVVAENLAWAVGSRATARGIVASWLASPGHRANLLRPGFRYVGVGALSGTFAGYRGALVVTADFAGS